MDKKKYIIIGIAVLAVIVSVVLVTCSLKDKETNKGDDSKNPAISLDDNKNDDADDKDNDKDNNNSNGGGLVVEENGDESVEGGDFGDFNDPDNGSSDKDSDDKDSDDKDSDDKDSDDKDSDDKDSDDKDSDDKDSTGNGGSQGDLNDEGSETKGNWSRFF